MSHQVQHNEALVVVAGIVSMIGVVVWASTSHPLPMVLGLGILMAALLIGTPPRPRP